MAVYLNKSDTLATIEGAGYFNEAWSTLKSAVHLLAIGSDGYREYTIAVDDQHVVSLTRYVNLSPAALAEALENASLEEEAAIVAALEGMGLGGTDGLAPLESPTFTGDPKAPTQAPGDNDTTIATTGFVTTAINAILAGVAGAGDTLAELYALINLRAPIASPTFTGTVAGITKAMVGLGNVDNTTDALKPVSTAQAAAIALKAPITPPTIAGVSGDATPNLAALGGASGVYAVTATAAYSITNFLNAVNGQEITIVNYGSFNVTVTRANAYLSGGVDQVLGANDSMKLLRTGSTWVQSGPVMANS